MKAFRLITYNIQRGGRGREARIAEVIAGCGADLVVLQEARAASVVEALADAAGFAVWGARDGQSLAFLSARPLDEAVWHRPRFSRHAFLELAPAGLPLRVFGVHLSAVHAAWTERRRTMELRALLAAVAREQHGFHVLTGDFNTLAPGELLDIRKLPHRLKALVWLSGGRIRWRTIQTVLDAGYADGYRLRHPDRAGHTFPTWDPHVRLDYVFLPATAAHRLSACEIVSTTPAADASDHFPLLADFLL
jgi:endonuclease/exonuclease/phosphatase family metal-dependent hydrolase